MEDKRYPIELEVLTPLSVGAGNDNEWTNGIDFVEKDGKVYVIDIQKAESQGIDMSRLAELYLNRDRKGMAILIGNKLESVSRLVFDSPVHSDNNIKTFLRTQLYDKPVVAGSSIKGAVRSVLFNYLRDNECADEEVFGRMKDGTDFMRFIRIGDIELPSTALVNSKVFNLRGHENQWQGGWKHAYTDKNGISHTDGKYSPVGFNTLYECALPGMKGLGNISMARDAFELLCKSGTRLSHAEKKRQLMDGSVRGLFEIINVHTREYLRKEKRFFEEYPAERTEELIDSLDRLLSLIPNDGSSCLLKMSAGAGFHAITGDWEYPNHIEPYDAHRHPRSKAPIPYKSRKIAEYGGSLYEMGFVKLRLLDADELQASNDALTQDHAERINRLVASYKQSVAEQQRAVMELRQREQQAKEEAEKLRQVEGPLEAANQDYLNGLWSDAIAKATEAKTLCPHNAVADEIITKCNRSKEVADYLRGVEKEREQQFKGSLRDVIKGKTSIGNLIGTTGKWLKVDGHSFGEEEFSALRQAFKGLPPKEQKTIRQKLGVIAKTIGEDFAKRLLNEKN